MPNSGTVQTVNDIAPDNDGNVALTSADIPHGEGTVDDILDALGTAANEDVGYFATAAQGSLADTSVQPLEVRTGGTVTLDSSASYFLDADEKVPLDGTVSEIVLSDTTQVLGSVALVWHKASAEPTITYGNFTLYGEVIGSYIETSDPSTLNCLMFTLVAPYTVTLTYRQNVSAPVPTASEVSYDNTTSGLTATDVNAAIDEVKDLADGAVSATSVAVVNAAATSKNPPIDADSFPIVDSAASNVIKRVTFTNLKAFLKTYYDTLYQAVFSTIPVSLTIACSDESTALTTGTGKVTFRMPHAMTLTGVKASVTTAPTGGTLLTVDINEAGSTILSTKLTFDASEKTTTTAATPAVISDTALADDAEITIDIDAVGSTIAGAGLKVTLIGTRAI